MIGWIVVSSSVIGMVMARLPSSAARMDLSRSVCTPRLPAGEIRVRRAGDADGDAPWLENPQGLRERVSSLGVQHYVSKPVDEQTFVRLIESLAAAKVAEPAMSKAAR